ncbi:Hypothetical protein, putative [Bodo saltans]|uniref:AAA+ ATPase domain-containing protein n=1 Tax=Bodo saltans TaxID=75058 RepID=A0A0S4JRN7_BODSA|nr:Hypothetical protein, putative [Bodo saltans]|eukprot:CUG91986.1 Hypothetical protein, putative [Bodo saltans]
MTDIPKLNFNSLNNYPHDHVQPSNNVAQPPVSQTASDSSSDVDDNQGNNSVDHDDHCFELIDFDEVVVQVVAVAPADDVVDVLTVIAPSDDEDKNEEYRTWKAAFNVKNGEQTPDVNDIELTDSLRRFGVQFYPMNEITTGRTVVDALMFQRKAILYFLEKCPTRVAERRSGEVDSSQVRSRCQACHIKELSREHFEEIEQIVQDSDVKTLPFNLRHTEWERIRELYTSLRSFSSLIGDRKARLFTDAVPVAEAVGDPFVPPSDQNEKHNFMVRVKKALDFVKHFVRALIPSHVFELGPVPSDEEIALLLSDNTLKHDDIYNIFSTIPEHRRSALNSIVSTFIDEHQSVQYDHNDLAGCRSLGYRAHAAIAGYHKSKLRALRHRDGATHFIAALASCSNSSSGTSPLLLALSSVIEAVNTIKDAVDWPSKVSTAFSELRKNCTGPGALEPVYVSLYEACSHVIGSVVMGDCRERLPDIIDAVLADDVTVDDANEVKHQRVLNTLVAYHAMNKTRGDDIGRIIVAGDVRPFLLRTRLSEVMATLFDKLSKCATATPFRRLSDEPSIPLPARLQQTIARAGSSSRGPCKIIDIGFPSNARYDVESAVGLEIKCFENQTGSTLDNAIIKVMDIKSKQRKSEVNVLRMEGSAVIDNVRCSITIVCRRRADGSVTYETLVDGQNISEDNPVKVVVTTTGRDDHRVQFHRIAQYVTGPSWRKQHRGDAIADKAFQVAAAVELNDKMKMKLISPTAISILDIMEYQSSKPLLEHLDALRDTIHQIWNAELNRTEHHNLAGELRQLLIGDRRVLAMSSREMHFARSILKELKYTVTDVEVDNLSFDTTRTKLQKYSQQSSNSFVHLKLVGLLDSKKIERVCTLVGNSSLRLLIVASPSTQHFASFGGATDTAAKEFHPTRVVRFTDTPFADDAVIGSVFESAKFASQTFAAHSNRQSFLQALINSSRLYRLTMVCCKDRCIDVEAVKRSLAAEVLDWRRVEPSVRALRDLLKIGDKRVVVCVGDAEPDLALIVVNERRVYANIVYAPMEDKSLSVLKDILHDSDSDICDEWIALRAKVSKPLISIAYNDFICVVPECEWLDHRRRVQLYLKVVFGVEPQASLMVLQMIRNVMSLPLASTMQVHAKGQKTNIEDTPHYSELVVAGTVTLDDALRRSFSDRSDIPWNMCVNLWKSTAPFSAETLTQILSVYPYRIRILIALGPSLFHTLSGVEFFNEGKPVPWAVDVAERICALTAELTRGMTDHFAAVSVMKWLFLLAGWNDSTAVQSRIIFDEVDFAALEKFGIVMDLLEAVRPADGTPISKREQMSSRTREGIMLMLASVEGSPNLFSRTQPQVLEYCFLTPEGGGMTDQSATTLMNALMSSGHYIGAPFLSILKDSTLHQLSALRKNPIVNTFWLWCHSSRLEAGGEVPQLMKRFSCNAWSYLFAAYPSRTSIISDFFARCNGLLNNSVFCGIVSLASEIPTALDAVTSLVLKEASASTSQLQTFLDDILSMPRIGPQVMHLQHLLTLLLLSSNVSTKSAMKFAQVKVDRTCYSQFKVELEPELEPILSLRFFNFHLFSEDDAGHFPSIVLFFSRCFSGAGRQHLLRVATKLLLDTTLRNKYHVSEKTLELAAAALWLLIPLAPSPLNTSAKIALRTMKTFLATEFTEEDVPVTLPDWDHEQRQQAKNDLRVVVLMFRRVVEAEYEIMPYIALALIDWVHYVPSAFLRALHHNGIIDTAPTETTVIIVRQGNTFPTYTLSYDSRPLPEVIFKKLFAPGTYDLNDTPMSFDISHGVSVAIIRQNLSFFVSVATGTWGRVDIATSCTCILIWLKNLGLFHNCATEDACKERLIGLEATGGEQMKSAISKYSFSLWSQLLKKENVVIRSKLPSFMDLHVRRSSAMLKLFDHSSTEGILYTLQTLSTALSILPRLPDNISEFKGEHFLADMVLRNGSDETRDSKMLRCLRIIACEIGLRLGSCWPTLPNAERQSYVRAAVATPFSLLAESKGNATEMLLLIADVATCQAMNDVERAQLCSAITLSIGFQDENAKISLMIPFFQLMKRQRPRPNYADVLNPTAQPSMDLTARVAAESRHWGVESTPLGLVKVDAPEPLEYIVDRPVLELFGELLKLPQPTELQEIEDNSEPLPTERLALFRKQTTPHASSDPTQGSSSTETLNAIHETAESVSVTQSTQDHTIDVSSIMTLFVPPNGMVSGGSLKVCAGEECVLLRDGNRQLRILPTSKIGDFRAMHPTMTTICYFDHYGQAWEYCTALPSPSVLVGRGFVYASFAGGWKLDISLAHKITSASLRPWHILAHHIVLGIPLHGDAEDHKKGGPYRILVWMCQRMCYALKKRIDAPDHEVQAMICILATCDDSDKEDYYKCLVEFLKNIERAIMESQGAHSSAAAIARAISDSSGMNRSRCETLGVSGRWSDRSTRFLQEALGCSLSYIVKGQLMSIVDPGNEECPEPATEKNRRIHQRTFATELTSRDLTRRVDDAVAAQENSRSRATIGIDKLKRLHDTTMSRQSTQDPQEEGGDRTNVPSSNIDDTLAVGTGFQLGSQDDVNYLLAKSFPSAQLVFVPIERKEKYHHFDGLTVGFVLAKRLFEQPSSTSCEREPIDALVKQWILQVLRSPLPLLWIEWFLLHIHTAAVWMPAIPEHQTKEKIIAHLLAWRCEDGNVRAIVTAAFGPLPRHCTRCNSNYGVIAMDRPAVNEWKRQGYDVEVITFSESERPQDEEAFRMMTAKFNPLTTHVVVYGYKEQTMSDTLLKWLCEYTFRYPWRFFILVGCDTTQNLPENRDRVTNFVPPKYQRSCITHSIEKRHQSWTGYVDYIPVGEKGHTERSCSWSQDVENIIGKDKHSRVLIHLISPPGAGKSTLVDKLSSNKGLGAFVKFDCSDDRLVEEALQTLLNMSLAREVSATNIVLVADEYHMLPERKKIEFMQWASGKLQHMKIIMIANRSDPLDVELITKLKEDYPESKETITHIEGRISVRKVEEVIRNKYSHSSSVTDQARSFYTFLSTLRGIFGDEAVSLRLESLFPRVNTSQKVDNFDLVTKLQDKLILFGGFFVSAVLTYYEQISVMVDAETFLMNDAERTTKIMELYRKQFKGSPIKLIVFTAMLVPLILYRSDLDTDQLCDKVLSYKDVVESTGSLRHAPTVVRLTIWARYVVLFATESRLSDEETTEILNTFRKLVLIDFPDFPIIEGENSFTLCSLSQQRTTFDQHDNLTDLNWIRRTLTRRVGVDWDAVKKTWANTAVTDSQSLCTIIAQAGPSTVFMSMTPSNVLQLLKRNPTGPFRDYVKLSYPESRIRDECETDESPFFFSLYSHLVMLEPSDPQLHVVEVTKLMNRCNLKKEFVVWISNHGSLVPAVPDREEERSTAIVKLVHTLTTELQFSKEALADLWRGKHLAPVANMFAESGEVLMSFTKAVDIVRGLPRHKAHDKWPFMTRLLHEIVSSTEKVLTVREANYLLAMGVAQQNDVPSRLIGALLQAEPPGWLDKESQMKLLKCPVRITDADLNTDDRYALNACRNVRQALQTVKRADLLLQCSSIQRLFDSELSDRV